ncbi:hypothetical protein JVU11DRAFT_11813 [Chiua virens]|nr:hypothetical protein JVU11DRAFT_11813 [Chiua virens]
MSPDNSNPKVLAVKTAIRAAREPFCSGICAIPDYQRLLYYSHGDLVRRIDVSNATPDDLDAMYRVCKPAEFGRGKESVFDESYRKAGKMDLNAFATQFDPRSLGIHEQVSKALLPEKHGMMDMELYKLNVYGKEDFFKAHKDTPRDQDMFGSLVVVFPTPHEGGQLVLRQDEKEWTIDSADNFANAKVPSACYVAFYSDIEHEVLPVSSGHRVTLTYNLYRAPTLPAISPFLTPQLLTLKRALVDLVNDKSTLPNGGYLGFGLVHEYVHTGQNILNLLLDQLKGCDRALADVCDALGLNYTLRLFYRHVITSPYVSLVTTKELELGDDVTFDDDVSDVERLEQAVTSKEAEVVDLIGDIKEFEYDDEETPQLPSRFRRDPTQVLEVTQMKSSLDFKTMFATYGNEVALEHFYGTACMLVAVEPATSRELLAV